MNARACLISLIVGGWAVTLRAAGPTRHQDVIDPRIVYQTIDNFGASDCWSMQKIGAWSDTNKARVADLLFSTDKGIGLTCWRFNLGGGINRKTIGNPWRTVETFETAEGRYDWTRQANERWFLRAAKARGVPQFIAFVNSPPARMTRNGLTNVDKGPHSTNLRDGFEGQFARYLVDILRHFRDNPDPNERIAFDAVSPVNEPSWEWLTGDGQEGNRASNEDINRIILALSAELKRQDLRTKILVPEARSPSAMYLTDRHMNKLHGGQWNNYIADFCGDPNVSGLLDKTLCYHSYWADWLSTQLIQHREQLGHAMARYPDWKLWQTEYCVMSGPHGKGGGGRDLGMNTALDVARVIHFDLTLAQASAWQWWTAVSPERFKDGIIYTDYRRPGDAETIFESKLLWTLGHFSRFIRPGMKRIGLIGPGHTPTGLLGSAYLDPATRRIVAIYINLADEQAEVAVRVAEAPTSSTARRWTACTTSDNAGDSLRPCEMSPDTACTIAPRSVVTITMTP